MYHTYIVLSRVWYSSLVKKHSSHTHTHTPIKVFPRFLFVLCFSDEHRFGTLDPRNGQSTDKCICLCNESFMCQRKTSPLLISKRHMTKLALLQLWTFSSTYKTQRNYEIIMLLWKSMHIFLISNKCIWNIWFWIFQSWKHFYKSCHDQWSIMICQAQTIVLV